MTFGQNLKADAAFCRSHKRAKNGQDYIPWAVELAEARQRHPDLVCGYGPVMAHAGMVGLLVSAWAQVGEDPRFEAQLAVTDMRNKTIERPSSSDVQNAQQRALTKAISMATGIGLSLWFGDVQAPTGEQPAQRNPGRPGRPGSTDGAQGRPPASQGSGGTQAAASRSAPGPKGPGGSVPDANRATGQQLKAVSDALEKLGVEGRDEALGALSAILERKLHSSADIRGSEVPGILAVLRARLLRQGGDGVAA